MHSACVFRNQVRGIGNLYRMSCSSEYTALTEEDSVTQGQVDAVESVLPRASMSDRDTAPTKEKAVFLHPPPDTGNSALSSSTVGRIVSMEFLLGVTYPPRYLSRSVSFK